LNDRYKVMKIPLTACLLVFTLSLHSQSFKIRDHYGNIVNKDTVAVIFHPGSNHGWTELAIDLYIQNISSSVKTLVVKKTEYDMRNDEYHAICFGGTCFDSTTFISPFKDPVNPGGIDSTFSGHYRFDDLLHPPGKCLVAYTFFDDSDKNDSAIVYIEYNTLEKSGITLTNNFSLVKSIWPNPSTGVVYFQFNTLNDNIQSCAVEIYNASGQLLNTIKMVTGREGGSVDFNNMPGGLYLLKINNGSEISEAFKIHIVH
jgi:hypothetical protein